MFEWVWGVLVVHLVKKGLNSPAEYRLEFSR